MIKKEIKRSRYSNIYKLDVARKVTHQDGNNISSVARTHGLPESTVRQWVKDLERLDSHVKSHGDLKTIHKDKQPTLSKILRSHCEEAINQDPPLNITAQVISNKATSISIELLKEYETNEEVMDLSEATALMKMTFSTSWAIDWARKNGFMTKKIKEEEAPVIDESDLFRNDIKKYEISNIYCLADPLFFYKVLPRQKYVLKSETGIKSTNSMKLKDRVTLYMCTNATGTDKIPLTMIGNAKNPRCFGKDNQKELFKYYYNNENAFSDSKTVKRWYIEVFLPHIRSVTAEKILLIVPFVSKEISSFDETKQVKCITLPANNDSFRSPMSMGVVECLKREYRYNLLKDILSSFQNRQKQRKESTKMSAGTAGLAEGREPHLLNAMEMLNEAWKGMKESVISVSWIKSGLVGDPSVLPYSIRRRNPITEPLQGAIDNIIFAIQDLELPKDTSKDDPNMDNLRATLKFYKNVGEDIYVDSLENWVKIEECEEVMNLIYDEREECYNADEEHFRDLLCEIQDALVDPRYTKAVAYIQDARNEFLRAARIKRVKIKEEIEYHAPVIDGNEYHAPLIDGNNLYDDMSNIEEV